uniref:Uncharacterized protein n=1 Tax=Glossina pallidipes TaxID=7398 RepID=A0A1B0A3T0_GLOPL
MCKPPERTVVENKAAEFAGTFEHTQVENDEESGEVGSDIVLSEWIPTQDNSKQFECKQTDVGHSVLNVSMIIRKNRFLSLNPKFNIRNQPEGLSTPKTMTNLAAHQSNIECALLKISKESEHVPSQYKGVNSDRLAAVFYDARVGGMQQANELVLNEGEYLCDMLSKYQEFNIVTIKKKPISRKEYCFGLIFKPAFAAPKGTSTQAHLNVIKADEAIHPKKSEYLKQWEKKKRKNHSNKILQFAPPRRKLFTISCSVEQVTDVLCGLPFLWIGEARMPYNDFFSLELYVALGLTEGDLLSAVKETYYI